MLTLESLAEECRPYHNDICIAHNCKLVRLLGVAESSDDYYYKAVELGGHVSYFSAVGSCTSLKATYPLPDEYAAMNSLFALNGAPPTENFVIEKLKD